MNSIKNVFEKKKQNGEKTNIGYIVAGYPNLEFTKDFLENLDKTSIDMLEVGVPYSDPIADGKLISKTSFAASEAGVTTDTVFDLVTEVKDKVTKPLIFLIYYNLIFSYGIDKFIEKCVKSGIKGLLVPDLPYEEAEELFEKAKKNNIDFIPFVSVTSQDRIKKITSRGSGFVYAIGSLGVTGSKQVDLQRLEKFIKNIRTKTNLPVSLGFGIKNNDNVNTMRKFADGVIVGTSIVEITKSNDVNSTIQKINELFK
ncbi:tryptophan synthase subunit alpha [Leptotrichia sp. oral taxon 847]|uniref:tryptophan synthase subunit alpha n=1 Tax=Leptotrichia sp. oral taxon 847 TaxID=1785996 RepID=UPI000B26641E|nr:tryptophan synthase subunit alpha [Leptotrichia sp. oral taxon 847]